MEVAVALGDVLTVLGRYREALAEFEAAASAIDGQQAGSAGIEHKLAEVHHRLGDWALAEAHLEVALDLLGPGDPSRRARIGADRAVLAYRRGAAQDAAGLAEGALEAARRAGDPAAVAQALNVLGMLDARRGAAGPAAARLRESLEHARGLPDPGAAVAALNNLAGCWPTAASRVRPCRWPRRRWRWAANWATSTGSPRCTPTWPTCCTRRGSVTRPWPT